MCPLAIGFFFIHLSQNSNSMNPNLRNSLAVIAGLVIGSVVNMALIMSSSSIIPPPEGADVTTLEGLKASIPLFQPKHFIMPFLAHALGTLVGAFIGAKLSANRPLPIAMIVGCVFLAGGIMNVMQLPAPMWFNALDLLGAYLPMAWLGYKLSGK